MTNDQIRKATLRYQERHGVDQAAATRAVLAFATLGMAQHMPTDLVGGMFAAARQALTGESHQPLEPIRVAAWKYLEDKHGTSVIVQDKADQAVRLLIGIAWDEPPSLEDVDPLLDYFLPIIADQPGLAQLLG